MQNNIKKIIGLVLSFLAQWNICAADAVKQVLPEVMIQATHKGSCITLKAFNKKKPEDTTLYGSILGYGDGNEFYITNIYVQPPYRNQGLGSRLFYTMLEKVDGLPENNEYEYVAVEAQTKKNCIESLIHFYEKFNGIITKDCRDNAIPHANFRFNRGPNGRFFQEYFKK